MIDGSVTCLNYHRPAFDSIELKRIDRVGALLCFVSTTRRHGLTSAVSLTRRGETL